MALTKLEYTRDWTKPYSESGGFNTHETDEAKVRADMQFQPNEIKAWANNLVNIELQDSANLGFGEEVTGFVGIENVKAALVKLYEDMQGISQGAVADGSITAAKLAELAVVAEKIADLAITTGKLADEAVTEAKLADDAVTTDKIDDEAVTMAKIADQAISNAKVLNFSLTHNKLATKANVAGAAVTADNIESKTITNAEIADNTIGAGQIANGAIGTDQLAGNIPNSKLADIVLTSAVTGVLPVANGGTGASTASGARTNLSVTEQGKLKIGGTEYTLRVDTSGASGYITFVT